MENAHQQDCATVYLFRQVYILPSNHEKIVFKDGKPQGYVLKLAIKIAIQAALKEEAKDTKGEESGVEDGSIGSV